MFQNVLMTVTPLSETKEINCWENRPFIHSWPASKYQKKTNKDPVNRTIKKKTKRNRTAYTTDQLRILENTFARTKYVDAERRKELADYLKIDEKCVKVWFQNRRMKDKKESSESSNDSSSECIAYEPVTPPPAKQQNSCEDKYIHPYNSYIEPTVHCNPESYYYPYEDNCKVFHPAYGNGYQNYVPTNYITPSVPSHTNECFRNDSTIYPTQYYPCSSVPEYMYTNQDHNHSGQNQQSTFSDVSNWSANAIDLNYF